MYFRQEHLFPDLFPRESYEAWEAKGQTEEEIAIARVKGILNSHVLEPLPKLVNELDRIMRAAQRQLLEE